MSDKRVKKTVVEIEQLYVVRQLKNAAPEICRQCSPPNASLVAPDVAAIVIGISTREIYRWVEQEFIHFRETANGSLLVCLNSFPINVDASPFGET